MKDSIKVTIYFIIFVVFLLISFIGYNKLLETKTTSIIKSEESSEYKTDEKIRLQEFELYLESGEKISSKKLIGKPLVINIWTSWCGYCDVEMPYFNELYLEEKDNVTFVMINATGDRDSKEKAKKYVNEKGYSFEIYYDLNLEAISALGIYSYPTTIFVDSNGYIDSVNTGIITKETLKNKIKSLK